MITRKPVVLLAPLDWGYGHTVRCIPIIRELLRQECEVLVACNSEQKLLLSYEFPSLQFTNLEGYNVNYGKNRMKTITTLLLQAPKILTKIKREHAWLQEFLAHNRVSAIISDNRYGFFSPDVPSIIITHQLRARSGLSTAIDSFLQKYLYSQINRFTVCWVPDFKDPYLNAAGKLSHPKLLPQIPVTYMGCLSRLEKCMDPGIPTNLLIILSGPEPQRSILETIIITELKTFKGTGVLIRGVMDVKPVAAINNMSILNFVSSNELNRLLCNSEIVICRAGYTSIMDILKLGKKAVLIPTPGQAEQEYLAENMHQQKLAHKANQRGFCLETILESARTSKLGAIVDRMDHYQKVVGEFVSTLKVVG